MADIYLAGAIILGSLSFLFAYLMHNTTRPYEKYFLFVVTLLCVVVSISFLYSVMTSPVVVTYSLNTTTNVITTTETLPGGFKEVVFSIETVVLWVIFLVLIAAGIQIFRKIVEYLKRLRGR